MTTRLGRNPYLRVLPNFLEGEEPFLVEDIDSRDTFQLDNSTFLDLLDQADPWTPRSQLEDYLMETYDASPAATDTILENAIDKRILVAETSDAAVGVPARGKWTEADWEDAFDFLRFIRDYPALDYGDHEEAVEIERETLDSYLEEESLPAHCKSYPTAPEITFSSDLQDRDISVSPGVFSKEELAEINVDDELVGSFDACLDPDSLDGEPSKETLGILLDLVFGFVGGTETPGQGRLPVRTSPSGGARQPTEAYPVIGPLDGVESGTYHYNPAENSLERLTEESGILDRAAAFEAPDFDPKIGIVLTSVVERNMWKYRYSKTLQVIFHDVGHLLETLSLVCNGLGLESRVTRAVDEEAIANTLDICYLDEPIYGVVLVG